MLNSFREVLGETLGSTTLTEVAEEMARMAGKEGTKRNVLSSLSRFQNGKRVPSRKKIEEIATALGSLRKMSQTRTKQLSEELIRAAGHGDPRASDLRVATRLDLSDRELRSCLRPDCYTALRSVESLKEHEIQTILDHIGVSTMKLIITTAEKGEEMEVVHLQRISEELQSTASSYTGHRMNATKEAKHEETRINAGRATILIQGDVSPHQMQVLKNAADMIESVLKL